MKKHLFFLYSICIIMIFGLFPYNIPFDLTHSYSENEPIQVMAASAGHTDIKHAKTLRSGTSFQTKAAPEGFHYYCLFAPASRGEMTIKIRSTQRISLSFQLYDQKGLLYPPSDYTYDPEEHLLTIHYDTTAYRRYLLGLFNDQKHSLRYTITYSYTKTAPSPSPIIKHKRSPQKPKPLGTAKPSDTAKPQTQRKSSPSSGRRTATSGKKAASLDKSKTTPGKKATSSDRSTTTFGKKPTNSASTNTPGKAASSKKKQGLKNNNSTQNSTNNSVHIGRKNAKTLTDNISKITLSKTFLHVRKGEAFSLHATAVTSQNYHLNWEFSSSGFLKKGSVKSRKNSSEITLTANRTGMVIVTCRTKENRTISCSCTIKITE